LVLAANFAFWLVARVLWFRRERRPNLDGARLADELAAKIAELGGGNVIAFIAETVVGATLGAVPAVPGYFKRVRELCDAHGILLILDEVMCGMGRCMPASRRASAPT
jgi:adenosylmethionine-8-amino-7-oxononanoate aminotransferase